MFGFVDLSLGTGGLPSVSTCWDELATLHDSVPSLSSWERFANSVSSLAGLNGTKVLRD